MLLCNGFLNINIYAKTYKSFNELCIRRVNLTDENSTPDTTWLISDQRLCFGIGRNPASHAAAPLTSVLFGDITILCGNNR